MDALQVHCVEWPEQGLERNEAHGGIGLLQVLEARQGRNVFNGNAKPDMRRDGPALIALTDETAHQRTALGEDLIDVPVRALHRVEYAMDELDGNIFMEKITHRIDEDELWVPPARRVLKSFGTQRQIKASLESMSLDIAKAFGKALGIAVVTTGTDLRATGDRVPGAVGPLDSAFVRHVSFLFR